MNKKILILLLLAWFQSVGQTNYQWSFTNEGSSGAIFQMLKCSNGDVLTSGFNNGDLDPDSGFVNYGEFITRYTPTKHLVFARSLFYNGNAPDLRLSLVLDQEGNFYRAFHGYGVFDLDSITGSGELDLGTGGYGFAKFDSLGNYLWGLVYPDPINIYDYEVLSDNSIVIVGEFSDTIDLDPGPGIFSANAAYSYAGYVAKFNSNGNFVDGKVIQAASGIWPDECVFLSVNKDSNDNLILTGYFEGDVDFDPDTGSYFLNGVQDQQFLLNLDSSMNFNYVLPFDQGIFINQVYVNNNNELILSGGAQFQADIDPGAGVTSINSQNNFECDYVAKFSSSGNFQWVKTIDNDDIMILGIKGIDSDGSIYCVVNYRDTINKNTFGLPTIRPDPFAGYIENYFFMKLDSTGAAIKYFDLNSGGIIRQNVLFTDPDHFYFSGSIEDSSDIELGPAILNEGPGTALNDQFFLSYYTFDSQTSRVAGKAYVDRNGNGVYNNNDIGLENSIIKISPDSVFTSIDHYGDYTAYLGLGNHTIEIPDYAASLTAPVPLTQSANFTSANQLDTANDFVFSFISNTRDLAIHLTQYGFARAGANMNYNITFSNNGTSNQSGVVELTLDTALTFISSSIAPSSVSGTILQWNYSTLKPFESRDIQVTVGISNGVNINDSIHSSVTITPLTNDINPSDNADASSVFVTGSYDPNFKEVSPVGNITTAFVTAGEYLTYTIHFQNTGNDTAFNITVLDTLSSKFDLTSFHLISSSHPCQFTLYRDNLAEFKFRTILLPDSATDEAGSNGFVKYQLKPITSLTAGDTLQNKAYIYFDHNDAVATNIAQTIIEIPVSVSGLNQNAALKFYPNPANESITIENSQKNISCVQLVDVFGKVCLMKQSNSSTRFQMNLHHLPEGVYFLKASDKNGNLLSVSKLIKE